MICALDLKSGVLPVKYSVSFKLRLLFDQAKRACDLTHNVEFIVTLHGINNGRVLHALAEMHNVALLLFRVIIKENREAKRYAPIMNLT